MNSSTSSARPRIAAVLVVALVAAVLATSHPAAVASTPERGPIDQQQPEWSPFSGVTGCPTTDSVGGFLQGVVPGASAWEVVSVLAATWRADPALITLEILDGTPDGPVLASAEAIVSGWTAEPEWTDYTFSPPVSLVPGSLVYLYLRVDGEGAWAQLSGDPYPAGDVYGTCGHGSPTPPMDLRREGRAPFDFVFATFAPASTSPTEPGDRDGDGIPDDRDPDMVGDVVRELPEAAFAARGHRTAFLSRLAAIEDRVAAGDDAGAVEELRNLRRRVDGCGSTADNNDWITDCAAQLEVRELIDTLITNLGG